MAGFSSTTSTVSGTASQQNYTFALSALTTLFFMWGFLTCLNDILIPHLKEVFDLNYTQGMLIQFCFFGAYFLVSLPAGLLVKKVGYKTGAVIGLVIAALGCLMFYPAAAMRDLGRGLARDALVDVGDEEVAALLGQRLGHGGTDAPPAAGDDDPAAVELTRHGNASD